MSKSKLFLICCVSFILGIALASFIPTEFIQHDLIFFSAIVGLISILILFWSFLKKTRISLVFVLIFLFFFLAFWRYSISLPQKTPDKIWYYNEQFLELKGIVNKEPDTRATNQKLTIKSQSPKGKILVTANLYPAYEYGDEVKIKCDLKTPEAFQGFAYDKYLERFDIYSVCYYPRINLLSKDNGNWFLAQIFKFKNQLSQIINFGLTEPAASLANAILLGNKKGINEDLREKFSQAGISHIVAISGMHISILSALVMGGLLAVGISRNTAFYFASAFLIFYITMIGLPASALRAGIMGFLLLLAMRFGRLSKSANSIALAGVILLFANPKLLRYDIGFQLSFLAVMGIIFYYPILKNLSQKYILKRVKNLKIKQCLGLILEVLNITLSAQMLILPIIALNFSRISLISPVANLAVLWSLPILMLAALAALLLSFIFPGLSPLFFAPSLFLLKYIILITEALIKIPYAYIDIEYINYFVIFIYYVLVVYFWIQFKKR